MGTDDDRAAMARYSTALVEAVDRVVADWIRRSVASRAPELADSDATELAASRGHSEIVAELTALFEVDIDDQRSGPLQVLRRGVRFATAVLAEAGVPAVERDEFDRRSFPDDIYGLNPASFAAVDESLHEPGLEWGAAKAHVHLIRRRPAPKPEAAEQPPPCIALSVDLMDRSKIQAAFDQVRFVRSVDKLIDSIETAGGADPVLVDLGRLGDPGAARAALDKIVAATRGRVIAFGSHVDTAMLQAATAAGADGLPRSVFFRRLVDSAEPGEAGQSV